MSSAYVREQFRTVVQAVLPGLGFAWFESMNQATRTQDLPKRWYTMEFTTASNARMALGTPSLIREAGSCLVQLFTEQQITDDIATANAEAVVQALTNWHDTSGQLRVLECDPVSDLDSGDLRGAFYTVGVDVRYTFDHFIDASPVLRATP